MPFSRIWSPSATLAVIFVLLTQSFLAPLTQLSQLASAHGAASSYVSYQNGQAIQATEKIKAQQPQALQNSQYQSPDTGGAKRPATPMISPTPIPPSPGDWFLNRPTDSSEWCVPGYGCYPGGAANDGDPSTFFSDANIGRRWWQVTIERAVSINRIRIDQGPADPQLCNTISVRTSQYGMLLGVFSVGPGWNDLNFTPVSSSSYYLACDNGNYDRGRWVMYSTEGYADDPPSTPQDYEYNGGGTGVEGTDPCGCGGDPVNTATGDFFHSFTDLSVPGRSLPLLFNRTYNSATSSQSGPLGYGWNHSYNWYIDQDPSNNDYLVHEGNGSIVPFGPDLTPPNRVEATLTNSGGTYNFTPIHGQTHYYFQPVGTPSVLKLSQIVDRNNYTTTLSYDASGRLQTVTDPTLPTGRTLTFHYDPTRTTLLTSVTDDTGGQAVSFQYYTGSDDLHIVTDVAGHQSTFAYYSGTHLLQTMTDPNGGSVTNTYDANSRVLQQTDPLSRLTQFGYSDLGNGSTSTTITNPLGLVTTHYYMYNVLTQIVQNPSAAQPAVTTYTYQPGTTRLSSVQDPNGNVSHMRWDTAGNVISTTDALQRTTLLAYNSTNDPTIITDTSGITTTFSYDAHGNLLSTSRPLTQANQLATTSLSYGDPLHPGDVTGVTDPNLHTSSMTYDSYGYLQSATNPLSKTVQYNHNSIGWLTSVTDPMSHSASAAYNSYGQPLVITDTRGYTTTNLYDNDGNLLSSTDANHRTTSYTYNLDNEVTRVTQPDGTHSDYGYDALGRVITQTNALRQSTLYHYDDLNRIVTTVDALNRSSKAAYDLVGNTTVITDAAGLTTTLGYDPAYQLRSITYHDGGVTPNVQYSYNSLGMRSVMTDGIGTSLYSYDSLNRLTSAQDGNGKSVGYNYDIGGRLTSLVYPGTTGTGIVTRGYDDANRLTSVQDWLSPPSSHTTQFGYNDDGALTSVGYPNGVTMQVGRDAASEVISMTDKLGASSPFLSMTYTHDAVGVIQSSVEPGSLGAATPHSYQYDQQYHLTSDKVGSNPLQGSTSTWQLDAATEITRTTSFVALSGVNTTSTRTYDAANELKSLLEKQGTTTTKDLRFTFNSDGERTQLYNKVSGATTTYRYDAAERLTSSGAAANPTNYRYNGDGVRVSKSTGLSSNSYVWGAGQDLLQDNTSSYIYGPGGMLVEAVQGTTPYYYHADQLGSIRAITNSSGAVSNTYTYDAYGNTTASAGTVANPFKYSGQYTDSETGFLYLRARYYDPATQQFLSVDPLLSQTEQAYA
ncbi:MAG: RHS repeat protein, partial [Chloroflexi bacterium]|nr:RHS repeat protein [Chloroflexota bacterium]